MPLDCDIPSGDVNSPSFVRRLSACLARLRDAHNVGRATVKFAAAATTDSVRVSGQAGFKVSSEVQLQILSTDGTLWYAPTVKDLAAGDGFTIVLRCTANRTGAVTVMWRWS